MVMPGRQLFSWVSYQYFVQILSFVNMNCSLPAIARVPELITILYCKHPLAICFIYKNSHDIMVL